MITTDEKVRELAREYREAFTTKQRDDGQSFTTLKDSYPDAPEDVQELVAATHDDRKMSPDDYRYEWTVNSLDLISDATEEEDLEDLAYEIEADIYTTDLIRWLGSRADRYCWVDEAIEEGFEPGTEGVIGDIMLGQAYEKEHVYRIVLGFLRERVEADTA